MISAWENGIQKVCGECKQCLAIEPKGKKGLDGICVPGTKLSWIFERPRFVIFLLECSLEVG